MPSMTFDYLTWEAFAAFSAVIAAFLVGRRQVGIAIRQADIQAQQLEIQNRLADLEELKLREALFDARYNVYNASRRWLVSTIRHGTPPLSSRKPKTTQTALERNLADDFLDAIDRSRFLFGHEVRAVLVKMWEAGNDLKSAERSLSRQTLSQLQRDRALTRHDQAFEYLESLVPEFANIFKDELTLTNRDRPTR